MGHLFCGERPDDTEDSNCEKDPDDNLYVSRDLIISGAAGTSVKNRAGITHGNAPPPRVSMEEGHEWNSGSGR